ncbi:MAG: MarR family transcriptional regulator [Candidatus Limnocylindrales bacterium]
MLAVVLRLGRAAAAAEDLLADATAESGLTASDALYLDRLVHLGHAGPWSRPVAIRDLAGAMGCAPSTLTTVVRRLERPGYLRRSQTPFDRRTVGIEASRPGEVAVAIFQAAARGPGRRAREGPGGEATR